MPLAQQQPHDFFFAGFFFATFTSRLVVVLGADASMFGVNWKAGRFSWGAVSTPGVNPGYAPGTITGLVGAMLVTYRGLLGASIVVT